MTALLRTADGIETIVQVPKFATEHRRVIIRKLKTSLDYDAFTVIAVRIYSYVGNKVDDGTPIYEEVYS